MEVNNSLSDTLLCSEHSGTDNLDCEIKARSRKTKGDQRGYRLSGKPSNSSHNSGFAMMGTKIA